MYDMRPGPESGRHLGVEAVKDLQVAGWSPDALPGGIGYQRRQPLFPQRSVSTHVQDGGRRDQRNRPFIFILSIFIQMNTSMRLRYCLEK